MNLLIFLSVGPGRLMISIAAVPAAGPRYAACCSLEASSERAADRISCDRGNYEDNASGAGFRAGAGLRAGALRRGTITIGVRRSDPRFDNRRSDVAVFAAQPHDITLRPFGCGGRIDRSPERPERSQ